MMHGMDTSFLVVIEMGEHPEHVPVDLKQVVRITSANPKFGSMIIGMTRQNWDQI